MSFKRSPNAFGQLNVWIIMVKKKVIIKDSEKEDCRST